VKAHVEWIVDRGMALFVGFLLIAWLAVSLMGAMGLLYGVY